jgi:diphthamide biosynthesis methyltransferase
MKNTHVVNVEENEDFNKLISSLEKWAGCEVTPTQREQIFEGLVAEAVKEKTAQLVKGDGFSAEAQKFLIKEGSVKKTLKEKFY